MKYKVGQKVKFRCGGEAKITNIEEMNNLTDVLIKFNNGSSHVQYTEDGLARFLPAIFDIVEGK